jgi:hypothetical protein
MESHIATGHVSGQANEPMLSTSNRNHPMFRLARFAALAAALVSLSAHAADPQNVSVTKIWDQGKHNAFTDLIRWHDKWYCTFREADAHVGGDGQLRVLESTDGEKWQSAALISEKSIDLRDPKLSITPDDRLMIVAGGSVYEGKTLNGRQPRVTFSKDAHNWTPPQRVLEEGEWLWRVTWHGGKAYGISYDAEERSSAAAQEAAKTGKVESGPAEWKLKLVSSSDGVKYDLITHLDVPGHPNETTLRFLPDGQMIALVRREGGNRLGWIGRSRAPYTKWQWTESKHQVGGPNFIRLPDGSLWAACRSYPGGAKTVLAKMTAAGDYEPKLTFASGGDTSYAGLVWHDGLLWMSYYSSHEGKTSIYLAKIKVPLDAAKIGTQRQPLVDADLIDRFVGSAKLAVQKPTPREVVLTANAPWEGNTSAYYTVFRDGDKFRMYYRGSHFDEKTQKIAHREVTCYAESADGIHWTKPELGLFEFDGSKQNNIVWDGPGAHCFAPFLDNNPAAAPAARYKAVTFVKGGLLPLGSPDGIHWTPLAEKPVITRGAFDSQNLAFWDSHIGKYREYHRAPRGGMRDIMTGTSDDFIHWAEPEFLDYPDSRPEELYTNTVQVYPGISEILIGFPTRILTPTVQTEPVFMVSRDGLTFRRYSEAIIPPTAPSDRTGNRSNYMAWGLLKLPGDKDWSVFAKEAYYIGTGSRLRRFTYRPDGLVALTAGADGGEAITRSLSFTGSKLVLNYRAAPKGSLRVELQDAEGQPISGFTAADSQRLIRDATDASVSWAKGSDLASLAGQPLRLRFVLADAELFAFRFE